MAYEFVGARMAAEMLGISTAAVHALVRRGTLAAWWCDGRRLFRRSELQRLMDCPRYRARSRARGRA